MLKLIFPKRHLGGGEACNYYLCLVPSHSSMKSAKYT